MTLIAEGFLIGQVAVVAGKNHGQIAAVFQYNYPIFTDDFRFRMEPDKFERLRSEYQYRREVYVE